MSEIQKQFKEIKRLHEENQKLSDSDQKEYFKQYEVIKVIIHKFLEMDFGLLDKKSLLLLAYFVYKYSVCGMHIFGMKCDRQLFLLKDK